jgi:AbrB family looped-hinge helix DNA binding protein
MSVSTTLQIRNKGSLTIPADFRRKYGLNEGDILTLVDMGDGAFILYPGVTVLDRLGDRVAQMMAEDNISLEDILSALDDERERYYKDRYLSENRSNA